MVSNNMIDIDQPMTPDEAAEWLKLEKIGYSVDTLKRWAKESKIECTHIGNKVMFLRDHLIRFVRKGIPEEGTRTLKRVR